MKSTHIDYISRGFVVRDKIRLRDNVEGAISLLGIIDSITTGYELVRGELVPEVVSESERNDTNFRYFVVYAPAGINSTAGSNR